MAPSHLSSNFLLFPIGMLRRKSPIGKKNNKSGDFILRRQVLNNENNIFIFFQNFKDNIRELSRIAFYLQVSQKTVEFSEKLTEHLLDHIQRKPITDLTLFCIQFSFIVQNNDRVPYWLISKMVDLVPQLSIRQVSFILSHNKNPKWKKHMEFRQALKTRIMDIITEESAKMDIVGEEL